MFTTALKKIIYELIDTYWDVNALRMGKDSFFRWN